MLTSSGHAKIRSSNHTFIKTSMRPFVISIAQCLVNSYSRKQLLVHLPIQLITYPIHSLTQLVHPSIYSATTESPTQIHMLTHLSQRLNHPLTISPSHSPIHSPFTPHTRQPTLIHLLLPYSHSTLSSLIPPFTLKLSQPNFFTQSLSIHPLHPFSNHSSTPLIPPTHVLPHALANS